MLSLRIAPSTQGKWATGLICCIAIAMKHSSPKAAKRFYHSEFHRDDIGLSPA